MRNFALRLIRRIIDLCLKTFQKPLQKRIRIRAFVLQLMGMRDMPRQIGQHNPPSERILPGAATNADVLPLFGDPHPHHLKGRFIALRYRRNA